MKLLVLKLAADGLDCGYLLAHYVESLAGIISGSLQMITLIWKTKRIQVSYLRSLNENSWELIYACIFIDFVAGIETESVLLGETSRRDPDALPPRTWAGRVCRLIYVIIHSLGHGNAVFAFKAGIMAGKSITSINIRKF